VTGSRDTFAAWLDVLVDTLDEPGLTGEEVAARLHLSRFHLDRVVSAAAGEAPGALRRRVLLERAAFRLAASRRPGPIHVEAANGIHFHPPAGIRLPAQRRVTAMDHVQQMVEHHVWLVGEIIDGAAQLTDAQLDEPIVLSVEDDPDPSTLRRVISRLVGQLAMWNATMASREYDFSVEVDESLTSARRRLAETAPLLIAHGRDAVEKGQLDDVFVDAASDPPYVCSYGAMVAHVLTFAAHRRTLAVLALDKHGVGRLGWGDPIEWIDAEVRAT
jgi:AraC-like DNA-binding protein